MRFAQSWTLTLLVVVAQLDARTPVNFHPDWFPGAQFAGIYVALDRGYYGEVDLDVSIEPFAYGKKTLQEIDANLDQCGLGAMEGYIFLQQRATGSDLKALAAMLQESPAGLMSLADEGIERAADLKGRIVGVHRHADVLVSGLLQRAGVAPGEVTLVLVDDNVQHLLRKEVTAMQGYATEELLRLKSETSRSSRFLSFRELGFDSYSEILFTTAAQERKHRATLARFVTATRRGWTAVFADLPAAVVAVQQRTGNKVSAAMLARRLAALEAFIAPKGQLPLAKMGIEKWTRMQAAAVEMKLLPQAEPAEAFLAQQE